MSGWITKEELIQISIGRVKNEEHSRSDPCKYHGWSAFWILASRFVGCKRIIKQVYESQMDGISWVSCELSALVWLGCWDDPMPVLLEGSLPYMIN